MLTRLRTVLCWVCLLLICIAAVPQPVAHAGFFDRIKDIYNTPEKISELEAQYLEAKAELAVQQQKLAESQKAAEEYARQQRELAAQNERVRQQNDQLITQNASLQAEVERMKKERKSLTDKLLLTLGIAASLLAAYLISLRLWRYSVWRRQRSAGGRGVGGG